MLEEMRLCGMEMVGDAILMAVGGSNERMRD
jgi:hypothetical protein